MSSSDSMLYETIQNRLYMGHYPLKVAADLSVPIGWVESVDEDVSEYMSMQASMESDAIVYGSR